VAFRSLSRPPVQAFSAVAEEVLWRRRREALIALQDSANDHARMEKTAPDVGGKTLLHGGHIA
jgi:hypothetical protein